MARKEAPKTDSTKGGANEVLGISLLALAGLFLLALYSFDRGDLSFNGTEVNDPLHNYAGTFGGGRGVARGFGRRGLGGQGGPGKGIHRPQA